MICIWTLELAKPLVCVSTGTHDVAEFVCMLIMYEESMCQIGKCQISNMAALNNHNGYSKSHV